MDSELLSKKMGVYPSLNHLNEMRAIVDNYKMMESLKGEVNALEEELKDIDKGTLEFSRLTSILNVKMGKYFKNIAVFEESIKDYIYSVNDNKKHCLWYLYEINCNGYACDLLKDIISEDTKKEKTVTFDGIVVPEKKYYNSDLTSDIDKLKHFRQISRQYFRYYAKYITLCVNNEKEASLNLVDKLMVKKYKKD
jgi:hypothetical protein